MTDQKTLQNLNDAFVRRMDNVHNVCKALAEQFKTHGVTIASFKEVIKDNHVEAGDDKILQAANQTMDAIEKACVVTAEKMESKVIPVSLIKQAIDKAKEGMLSAIKSVPTKKKYVRKSASAKSKKAPVKKSNK